MPTFESSFLVHGHDPSRVAAFHQTNVSEIFPLLSPPGCAVEIDPARRLARMSDGAELRFTMYLAFCYPIRWHAVHRDVSTSGFTDEMVDGPPMQKWVHRHQFRAPAPDRSGAGGGPNINTNPSSSTSSSGPNVISVTEVYDKIEYEYAQPWYSLGGILGRTLFNPGALWLLFTWRAYATRKALKTWSVDGVEDNDSTSLERPLLDRTAHNHKIKEK
ncbi:unnamed protein product [Amoebophrya sp. A25]|nr:unnamed protein product [Amoebophrya sp. A25]|eukprot:GSA25T00026247001.1